MSEAEIRDNEKQKYLGCEKYKKTLGCEHTQTSFHVSSSCCTEPMSSLRPMNSNTFLFMGLWVQRIKPQAIYSGYL